MRPARQSDSDIELSYGPHPARPGWRVLRVSYPMQPEPETRVAKALEVLVTPVQASVAADRSPVVTAPPAEAVTR